MNPSLTEVKILSDTPDGFRVGGHGIVFGGQDVTKDFFTESTDFWFDRLTETPMVLFDHGQDGMLKRSVVGRVDAKRVDDVGLWIEAQITTSKKYRDAIRALVEKGVLGWSSGAVGHLVDRVKQADGRGWLKSWPIAEFSLTATPAEPRTLGVGMLKTLIVAEPNLKSVLADDVIETKPYRIAKRGGQFCVIGPTGRQMGCHDTRAGAIRQQRALYANEGKSLTMSDLADSAFAYVESGGALDDEKKTVPRAKRHFPHHLEDGSVDPESLVVAFEDAASSEHAAEALAHLKRHLMAEGIEIPTGHDDAHNPEWREGAAPALLLAAMKLSTLAEEVAGEMVAIRHLDMDTKAYRRIRSELRLKINDVEREIAEVRSWAETVDRGEDGQAYVERMKSELALFELETGGLTHG